MFERPKALFSRGITTLGAYPATSFFVLLALLFGIIVLGNILRTPEDTSNQSAVEAKETKLFDTATDTAVITVPAKVKKESVINIVALTPGIVSNILVSPGRSVAAGQTLFTLTNDYQSGSSEVAKSLARETARLTEELAKIDKRITELEEKKAKQNDSLSDTEQDLELANLKKDRATRKSTIEQSGLSLQLSNLSDAVLKPKTFASGTVQSIRVKRGDLVAPGTVLATLSAPRGATTLETLLDQKTARLFDATKEAMVMIEGETIMLRPTYFGSSENENGLFPILFTLSEDVKNKIVNGEFLKITLPLKSTDEALTLIPIDALFQDENHASVLVERDGKAVALTITLGNIYGNFAEVRSGLNLGDRIILNRSVISGDSVSFVQ